MTLTAEQLAFFNENGYVVAEDVISDAFCDELSRDADALGGEKFVPIQSIHRKADSFLRLCRHPLLLSHLDSLQNKRKIPINTTFIFSKPQNPFENGSIPHQDWPGPKAQPVDTHNVVGIALDGADPDNGSLVVFPGSHKAGVLPFIENPTFSDYNQNKDSVVKPVGHGCEVPEQYKPLPLTYPRGSAVIMHSLLIHYAPRNVSATRWRRHCYIDCVCDGDPFWPGWASQRALIDRMGN